MKLLCIIAGILLCSCTQTSSQHSSRNNEITYVEHGHYEYTLKCDEGYTSIAAQCVNDSNTEPTALNNNHTGNHLFCNDGFKNESGECIKLPDIENGKYLGSIPICNGGYTLVNGNCTQSSSTSYNVTPYKFYGERCAENGTCYGDISTVTGRPKTVNVRGYFRKDGTYVRGHYRSR